MYILFHFTDPDLLEEKLRGVERARQRMQEKYNESAKTALEIEEEVFYILLFSNFLIFHIQLSQTYACWSIFEIVGVAERGGGIWNNQM